MDSEIHHGSTGTSCTTARRTLGSFFTPNVPPEDDLSGCCTYAPSTQPPAPVIAPAIATVPPAPVALLPPQTRPQTLPAPLLSTH
jgi:hypothetical protein